MEFQRISSAIELFGAAPPPPPPPREQSVANEAQPAEKPPVSPKLGIGWGEFHQGAWSSLAALFGPSARKGARSAFRDSWVERRVPGRGVVTAALWHVALLLMPFSLLTGVPKRNPAFENLEITWRGPIEDLPLLEIPREAPKPEPKASAKETVTVPVVEGFHPRQRIFTDPVRPNHPRQTLVNPKAPAIAPKLAANMPNIAELQKIAGPAKPRLQIDEEMLKKLRPKEKKAATTAVESPVDMPNMERQAAEMSLPAAQSGPARPKLQLNAGAAPRVADRSAPGDAGPAPEIAAQSGTTHGGPNTLIALSANPAPPAPVEPPAGNLAARIAVSPEGKPTTGPTGAAGGESSGSGAGKNSVGISISGGNPPANPTPTAKIVAPARKLMTRPEPKAESEDVAERTGPPDFASLPPGAKPEVIFASKKVYTLNVNMPNLNSSTGSWILNFSELHSEGERRHTASGSDDLSGPMPLKKIDPKYPPTLVAERVAGEVILYAVIRRDGSVDSIQVVRGVDQQLDKNAMAALSQWRFRPGSRQGNPIELEAIVHIPFRLPEE